MIKVYDSKTVPDELLMLYKVSNIYHNPEEFELYGFISITDAIDKIIVVDDYIDFEGEKYLPVGYFYLSTIVGLSISYYRKGTNLFSSLDAFIRAHLEHSI